MLERGRGSRTQVGFLHGAVMQVSLSYSPQVFFFFHLPAQPRPKKKEKSSKEHEKQNTGEPCEGGTGAQCPVQCA